MAGLSRLLRVFTSRSARPAPAAACADGSSSTPVAAPQEPAAEALSVTHQWSQLPNALRLQINRRLLPLGDKRTYVTQEEAGESPLAQALFESGGIESVSIEAFSVNVEMDEDADWEAIRNRLPHLLRKFLNAGGVAVHQTQAKDMETPKKYSFGFKQVAQRPREEQLRIVQELFDNEVNPAVAAHGGHFTLLDVKDNTVYVELGGGCQGCGMANVTLRQGVEERLKQVLPEMVALVDNTDHASGSSPYYQSGKK